MLKVIIKCTPQGLTQMELFANAAVTVSRRQGDVVGIALVVDQQTLGRDASTVHFHQASIHFAETRIVDFESGSGKDMWKTVIGVDVWLCSDLETARTCAGEAANRWNVAGEHVEHRIGARCCHRGCPGVALHTLEDITGQEEWRGRGDCQGDG